MYSSISLNNTERKEIGVPILKRTDEMIAEFNLDYEKNYKLDKFSAEKEKAFKEFLKQQEQRQFYLRNLIKIIRIYFKENNYNQDTYYFEYIHINKKYTNKKRRKKRTKSFLLPKNKFIYYQLFKESSMYKFYQPWIYSLGERDKNKSVHHKLKTDFNIITKKDIVRIDKSQLKLYVEIFGIIPVNYIKKEKEGKNKNKNINKSTYYFLRNYYSTNSFDNKTHLLLKKGKLKEKYYGGYEKMKKYIYMKNRNITNLKAKSANRLINNRYINSTKNRSSINILYNKSSIFKNNNHSVINQNKKGINNNNINNNRYINLKNNTIINKKNKNNNSYYNNFSSINSAASFNNNTKARTFHNRFSINNNVNMNDSKSSFNNNNNKINLIKNTTHDYLSKFKNEYTKTMKKSKVLNKDISFLNRIFSLSKNNYNKTKKIFEENKIKKISMLNMVKHDIFAQKRKAMSQFKYVKENMSGNIKINFLSFVRTPQSKLIFVRDFNKQREQSKYKEIDIETNEDSDNDNDIEEIYDYIDKESKNLINQKKKINLKFNNVNNSKK